MNNKTNPNPGVSLRTRVTGWLAAILLITLLSTGIATGVGRWTVRSFDTNLSDNAACYNVQDAIKAESRAFVHYAREPSTESREEYTSACARTEACLAALPFDYDRIGEDRYARTWNLLQGYDGYRQQRDAFFQISPTADTYIDQMYHIMSLQDYLSGYALRLTRVTLEQQTADYGKLSALLNRLPLLYLLLFFVAAVLMLLILKLLSTAVVAPLLRLVSASRSIARNEFETEDLPVTTRNEVGQLTATFNQMKHAMADHIATLNALHREEVRNLALEKDLEHTRLEVLKSQVNPHFLFNTLNMISCMARLEDASTTDRMIVSLGNLFRHNLQTKQQTVTLEEELDALQDYLYLQQMRFDGRITFEKKVLVDPAAVRLPSFTLQPVIENSFTHGLKSCEEGGRILLRVWMQQEKLILTIADNGRGMTPQELAELKQKTQHSEQTGKSIGLGNISRRVDLLYPGGSVQVYSRPEHGTVVRFEIPQNQEEEPS